MMRFMCLYKPASFAPPTPEKMAEMRKFVEETKQAGILLATDGVQPGGKVLRARMSDGKFTVTDGPFSESKEIVGGYAILQVKSIEELLDVSQRFLKIAGDGESEILQMFEYGPPPGCA